MAGIDSGPGRKVKSSEAAEITEITHAFREALPYLCDSEGKPDVARLRALFETDDPNNQRYGLSWAGKHRALTALRIPHDQILQSNAPYESGDHAVVIGDNLNALRCLYRAYFNRVKLIFIDPPYNTGIDRIYRDDYSTLRQDYLEESGQAVNGDLLTSNVETSGRFHSAWLSMMYPRLFLARQLLRDDGVLYVTIDDNEVYNLRLVLNELFGEENFITQIEWQKRYTRSNNTDGFTSVIDHILVYAASPAYRPNLLARDDTADKRYSNPDNDPRGPWKATPFLNQVSPERRPNLAYEIVNPNTAQTTRPTAKAWRYERSVFERLLRESRLWWGKDGSVAVPVIKTFLSEVRKGMTPTNFWSYDFAGHTDQANAEIKEIFGSKVFDTPKPVRLIERILELATTPNSNDHVLDFFAGSGTTGDAVLRVNARDGGNRRVILVQYPEPLSQSATAKSGTRLETVADVIVERMRYRETELSGTLDSSEAKGFRVFGPASIRYAPDLATDELNDAARALGLAISQGLQLNSVVDVLQHSAESRLFHVTDPEQGREVFVALGPSISLDSVEEAAVPAGATLIVYDDCVASDTDMANMNIRFALVVL